MEVATVAPGFALHRPVSTSKTSCQALKPSRSPNRCSSLFTSFGSPISYGRVCREFSGLTLRPSSLNPSYFLGSERKRDCVTMVVNPYYFEEGSDPPQDLKTYLFQNRIVYLGTPIATQVYELLFTQLMYLGSLAKSRPINFYINSTGSFQGDLQNEVEIFVLQDVMRMSKPPIYTLCLGTAWAEAALLLAAGTKGHRFSLPSASMMIRQPITTFEGQASAIAGGREIITDVKSDVVKLLSRYTGKSPEQIGADIERPKYFNPNEAVEYGIIDKVFLKDRSLVDPGITAEMALQ